MLSACVTLKKKRALHVYNVSFYHLLRLFQLNLGTPQKLHELESDTWEYWKRMRKENIWRFNRLHKGKKF